MMDSSTYRRRRVSRRRRSVGKKTSPFIVALIILVFAVAINYIFPHFSKAVGDKVNSVIDYRSAFSVLGEGITGERKFTEALGDAWTVAFKKNKEDEYVSESVMADVQITPTPPAEITPDISKYSTDINDPNVYAEHFGDEEDDLMEAIIAAFYESQRNYADYMTPAGAGYI